MDAPLIFRFSRGLVAVMSVRGCRLSRSCRWSKVFALTGSANSVL